MNKNKAIVYLAGLFVFVLVIGLGLGVVCNQYFSLKDNKYDWSKFLVGAMDVNNSNQYLVVRVVDGDTLVANIDGKDEKVRLIGIDTPESVDPRKEVECFGKEASKELGRLVENKYVGLEVDQSQSDRDKYGRLLRYVWLKDININQVMIENGFAHEYTYDLPYMYQADFKNAQKMAEKNNKGLWGECKNN